jgi:hypothetical protein
MRWKNSSENSRAILKHRHAVASNGSGYFSLAIGPAFYRGKSLVSFWVSGGVLWIIVTDAFFKVSDGFAETAADLGQLRWAENN